MNTRTDTRPNIVLLFPDQWRHDALSVLGHPVAETPFLDQIAHQGVRFTSAYSPAPTCIATRASLATGCSPNTCGRIGYRDFVPWTYPDTFMRLLRDGGYQTLCAGKTHFHPARARLGFEELALYEVEWQMPGEPSDYHRFLLRETGGRVQDSATTHDSNSMHAVPWTHDENLHATNWTVGAALEMLERRDPQRPFFLQVCPHRPHPPFDPPLAWFERFANAELPDPPVGDWATEGGHPATTIDAYGGQVPKKTFDRNRRAYYAQLAHLDNQFCRLWRFLKGRKLLANTWIFFMSDHGEFLGDHHLFRKTAPFEGAAHIPLLVKAPDGADVPRDVACDVPLTVADLAPTFLDIAGIPAPAAMEGRSLLPHVSAPDAAPPPHEFVHIEHAPKWQAVTDGKAKYVWDSQQGREWFFDLVADPQERHDLSRDPDAAPRVSVWRDRLVAILARRPEDGLVEDGRLVPGKTFAAVKPGLAGSV